jgi:prepilin-type processing-associated H-X9-DG protein
VGRGGANFAFCDGSVHFLKDSIDSWTFPPVANAGAAVAALPVGATLTGTYPSLIFSGGAGFRVGVYQALGSRNGGEVISADAY